MGRGRRLVGWAAADLVAVRTTWDYSLRRDEFLAWAARVDASPATLQNPLSVLEWNSHKRYLVELSEAGRAGGPDAARPRRDRARAPIGVLS